MLSYRGIQSASEDREVVSIDFFLKIRMDFCDFFICVLAISQFLHKANEIIRDISFYLLNFSAH